MASRHHIVIARYRHEPHRGDIYPDTVCHPDT